MYGANALLPAISIHALHEENDGDAVEDRADLRISIHALHEESDMLRESEAYGPSSFQSTLSMRRATRRLEDGSHRIPYFNPRSP